MECTLIDVQQKSAPAMQQRPVIITLFFFGKANN